MKVNISLKELEFNIRNKSHSELSLIPAEQRYQWEAGTDKTAELRRCMAEAYAVLQENLSRFLKLDEDLGDMGTDEAVLPDVLVLYFQDSGRRMAGRGQTLADECLAYLTDATLARFYLSVSSGELADKHNKMADAELAFILRLLYTKLPPRSVHTIVNPYTVRFDEGQTAKIKETRVIETDPETGETVVRDVDESAPRTERAAAPVQKPTVVETPTYPEIVETQTVVEPEEEEEEVIQPEEESPMEPPVNVAAEPVPMMYAVSEAPEVPVVPARDAVRMIVNTLGDKVLFSNDLGDSYVAVATPTGSPNPVNITNSNPSGCDVNKDGKCVSSNISRVAKYNTFGGRSSAAFSYSTQFELPDGTKKKINTSGTAYFKSYGCFIADNGDMVFHAFVRFEGESETKFCQLYSTASGWKVSYAWPTSAMNRIYASENMGVMVCPGQVSFDKGLTLQDLPSSLPVGETIVSGNGEVIYAIREEYDKYGRFQKCWLSLTTDYGQNWFNLFDFKAVAEGDLRNLTIFLATNYDGSCVAFALGNQLFGWSPDMGASFRLDELGYEYRFNLVSMDRSGYYVAVTNTTEGRPTAYTSANMHSRIYIKNMHNGQTKVPNINGAFNSIVSAVKLR